MFLEISPPVIGEIFGGARLDLGGAESIRQAQQWAPDVIVAEAFDAIGPFVAARLGVAWHQVGIGAGLPTVIADEIERAAATEIAGRPSSADIVKDLTSG